MSMCDFDDIQLQSGQWQHICRTCGVLRVTKKKKLTRTCGKKTLVEQFGDSASSLMETAAKALETGYVTPEVFEQRMNLCRDCPFFKAESQKCGHCGCYMRVKASLDTAACPIEKWGPVLADVAPEQPNQEVVRELLIGQEAVNDTTVDATAELLLKAYPEILKQEKNL